MIVLIKVNHSLFEKHHHGEEGKISRPMDQGQGLLIFQVNNESINGLGLDEI